MNDSNLDSKNDTKQNAGGASAHAIPTQEAGKANGGTTFGQDKDKQQGPQSHKTDGAASDQSGKDATADEGKQDATAVQPGSSTGKTGEASPALSAKSKS